MSQKINIIFMGSFTYPYGMAGTKRIQHAIDALSRVPDVFVRVVLLRQLSCENGYSGLHDGVPYHTIMGGLTRYRLMVLFPVLYIKFFFFLRQCWRKDCKNIIYHYGSITLENLVPLYLARRIGYKIVFDIVEDYDVAEIFSRSFFQRIRVGGIKKLQYRMKDIASGFIVISSHLERKYKNFTQGKPPVHYRPISIDMGWFPVKSGYKMNNIVSLFYAGSFAIKDGLLELLDAFDSLAAKKYNVNLILTGRGDSEAMQAFYERLDASPFKNRINYKGYLDDNAYYNILNSSDIHCMTRVDLAYANAGFPFKLGEYLASGKPVIASCVSDVDHFLVNRQSAMLVQPGDSKEIIRAVEFLMNNSEAASLIGRQGREVAFSHFDHRVQGKALLFFLREL